ncbi:discoidin domain receptor, partial [Schistosoma japonicum]
PNGVKSVNKDLGPLTLPPSAFSASSVYQNKPEYQPHKANDYTILTVEQLIDMLKFYHCNQLSSIFRG